MNKFQQQIWVNNYKAPEDNSIQDTWRRIAYAIAEPQTDIELKNLLQLQFFNIMNQWKFIPGGRIIANAGTANHNKATLYNCYVYHPYDFGIRDIDSMQGIFQSLKKSSKILASQGGLGLNLSFIRPNGSYITGTGARTPGVVKFMQLWDKASQIITMGSTKVVSDKYSNTAKKKIRKGAMLCALDISHAQILDFIAAKQTSNRLTKFNLSLLISDRFMQAVERNQMWRLVFPDTQYQHYKEQWDGDLQGWIRSGKPVVEYQRMPAKQLWDLIMSSTYNRNQPGVLFYDTINDYNPVGYCERILTTNPCGQIPQPSNVCNLGSLNLTKFYHDGEFDWQDFQRVIKFAVYFLDNVCDVSYVPLQQYKQKILEKRRIGLGVMGLGSLLMMMQLKFGSHEAIQFVDKLFRFKSEIQLLTSARIGVMKGSFKHFDKELYFTNKWWYQLPISYKIKRDIQNIGCMRNSVHSTCPPTGNSAIFAGQVSNGIQPVFMKEYTRWVIMTDQQKQELNNKINNLWHDSIPQGYQYDHDIPVHKIPNPQLGQWWQTDIFKFALRGNEQILRGTIDGIIYQIDKNRGLIKSMQVIDYGWKYVNQNIESQNYDWCVTTNELTVDDHINMLATSAKYIDQNQSKTINIPENYSYQNFKNVYFNAWKRRIKGITTYRANTMPAVLQQTSKPQYRSQLEQMFKQIGGDIIFQDVKIPDKSFALQYKIKDKNKKKWYFTLSFVDSKFTIPFALFIRTNQRQSNEVADSLITAMQSLLSTMGISDQLISQQRQKYQGQSNVDKIGRAIGMALRHNVPIQMIVQTLQRHNDGLSTLLFHIKKILSQYIPDFTQVKNKSCPECNSTNLIYISGCSSCSDCGYSGCS